MLIVVTNDDGVLAPGIAAMREAGVAFWNSGDLD